MSNLYETDILAWSEEQAALLRAEAAADRRNAGAPDWPHIVEEIESVGRSQLATVRSLLIQALAHDLKCECWPLAREVEHWRAEARGFRIDAAELVLALYAATPSGRRSVCKGAAAAARHARRHAAIAGAGRMPGDTG